MTEHRINLDRLAKVRDGTGHSIFSPSSSGMWLNCSGSLIPNLLIPDEGNPDAAYGTVAHGLTEQWLKTGRPPTEWIGWVEWVQAHTKGYAVEIDEDMLAYVEQCVEYCEWQDGQHLVERRVDFSKYTPIPRQKGTLDHAALIFRKKTTVVTDHKYGKHKQVFAKDNTQAMIYALALILEFEEMQSWGRDGKIVLRIGQPRLDHFDEWETNVAHLLEFGEYVRERATAAWQLDAPRTPGTQQCEFCKVRGTCAAAAKMQEEFTAAAWEPDSTITPEDMQAFKDRLDDPKNFQLKVADAYSLSTEQLAALLPHRKTAERFWKAVAAEVQNRAQQGMHVPGWKFVEGRGPRRAWMLKHRAAERLQQLGIPFDEIFEETVISPAKAEKMLIKHGHKRKELPNLLEGYVFKPAGKATLVPESDKRPALVDLSSYAFDEDDDDSTTETEEL